MLLEGSLQKEMPRRPILKSQKNKTETPGQRNPFHGFLTETHELIRKPSENQKKQ